MAKAIEILSINDIANSLRDLGFRAEILNGADGSSSIASASGGVNFTLRPGNRSEKGFTDFSLAVAFRVEDALAHMAVAEWNRSKRFGRLYDRDGMVILEMDVIVGGGVMPQFLRGNLEIWNRLLNELLVYLKDNGQRLESPRRPAAA